MIERRSLRRFIHSIRSVITYGAANLAGLFAMMLAVPILTRIYSPDQYGIVGMFNSAVALLPLVLGANGHLLMLWRYHTSTPAERNGTVTATARVAMTAAILLGLLVAGALFLGAIDTQVAAMSLGAIMTSILAVPALLAAHAFQARAEPARYFSLASAIPVLGTVATVLFAVLLLPDWRSRVVGGIVGAGITVRWSLRALKSVDISINWRGPSQLVPLLRFGVPLIPHVVGLWSINFADRFLLAGLSGLEDAGYYTVAYSISLGVAALHDGVSRFFAPRLAKWVAADSEDGRVKGYRFARIYVLASLASLPVVIPAVLFVANLLLGSAYAPSFRFLVPLVIAQTLAGPSGVFTAFLYVDGRTGTRAVISSLGAIFNIAATILGIRAIGPIGAAYATLFTMGLMSTMTYVAAQKTRNDIVPAA